MKLQNILLHVILPYFIVFSFYALWVAVLILLYHYCRWLFYITSSLSGLLVLYWLLEVICRRIVYKKPPDYHIDFEDEEFGYDYLIQNKHYNSKTMRIIQRFAMKVIDLLEYIPERIGLL